jgi:hypothetical protein
MVKFVDEEPIPFPELLSNLQKVYIMSVYFDKSRFGQTVDHAFNLNSLCPSSSRINVDYGRESANVAYDIPTKSSHQLYFYNVVSPTRTWSTRNTPGWQLYAAG